MITVDIFLLVVMSLPNGLSLAKIVQKVRIAGRNKAAYRIEVYQKLNVFKNYDLVNVSWT